MRRAALIAAALAVSVAAPASASSIFDYGHAPDTRVVVDGRTFEITVHTKRDTMLIRPTTGEAFSLTDLVNNWPLSVYRQAAEVFVAPLGCGIESVKVVLKPNYEASFVCPAGVDLHELVFAQHADLARGAPLHP
jgi:hypothetical protein